MEGHRLHCARLNLEVSFKPRQRFSARFVGPAKMFVERDELTSMGDLLAQPSFDKDDSVTKPRIEEQ